MRHFRRQTQTRATSPATIGSTTPPAAIDPISEASVRFAVRWCASQVSKCRLAEPMTGAWPITSVSRYAAPIEHAMISNRPPSAAARKTSAGWRQPSAEANRSAAPSGAGSSTGTPDPLVLRARAAGIVLVSVDSMRTCLSAGQLRQTKPVVLVLPERVIGKSVNAVSKVECPPSFSSFSPLPSA